jgi:hypothetical protein
MRTDTQGFCRLSPCQNGGTCYQWGVEKSDFYCFCDEPYYGELCQYDWGEWIVNSDKTVRVNHARYKLLSFI